MTRQADDTAWGRLHRPAVGGSEAGSPPAGPPSPPAPQPGPPVPLDGGWGWVVVLGSLVCNIIVDGVCFSFGIFYPEFLRFFGETRGKTAIVGSMIPGMYLGIGPITSALANKFGCRAVTMAGSLLASVSFFLSTFSPNVNVLIFTYGIMGGTGFGLMYLPSIVIVGFYFNKRRALATGLAVCGSGIGTFFFAPFARYLLDTYGWQGGYWIIAGIILNGCVCGALFRPLEATQVSPTPQEVKCDDKKKERQHGIIFKKIIDEKKRLRTTSMGSLDGAIITRDNQLISGPGEAKSMKSTKSVKSTKSAKNVKSGILTRLGVVAEENCPQRVPPRLANSRVATLKGEAADFRPPPPPLPPPPPEVSDQSAEEDNTSTGTGNQLTAPLLDVDADPKSLVSSTRSLAMFPLTSLEAPPPMRSRASSESRRRQGCYRVSRQGEKVLVEEEAGRLSTHDVRVRALARPLNRKDIFYTGSVVNLREFKMSQDLNSYLASNTTIPSPDEDLSNDFLSPLVSVLKEMLDFSLMKSPTFLLLCLTSILAMTGFFTPFVYITDNAIQLGISPVNAAYLLSVLGICNTFGRIMCGLVSDMPWADCLIIHNVALVIAGISTCFVPFLHSFPLLCIFCVVFGFCIGAFITLRSIVLVDLLGLQRLTSSFGLLLLFQGIASVIGSPIAGAIFDSTQSYTLSFIVSGGLIAIAGLIGLPVRRVASWEARKWGPLGGETDYTVVPHEQPQK